MTHETEGYEPTPSKPSPRDVFLSSASDASKLLHELGYSETPMPEFRTFVDSIFDNGTIVFSGSDRYESDMVRASKNATKRPFGIEVSTLSDNVQLVLYPRMIYPPSEGDVATAEEMELTVRRDGPQAMVYPLDGIDSERERTADNAANLLFMGHLVDALLTGKYPLDRDSHSPEFTGALKKSSS